MLETEVLQENQTRIFVSSKVYKIINEEANNVYAWKHPTDQLEMVPNVGLLIPLLRKKVSFHCVYAASKMYLKPVALIKIIQSLSTSYT
jgi:hypothetical protein